MDRSGRRSFDCRLITIAPDVVHPYRSSDWRDALVVVERGDLELEGFSGRRYRFGRGAILSLDGLPVRALRSAGRESTRLIAVARRPRVPI